jgi:hypothetical protein
MRFAWSLSQKVTFDRNPDQELMGPHTGFARVPPNEPSDDDAPACDTPLTRCLICEVEYDAEDFGLVLFHSAIGHAPIPQDPDH